jgi:hypothetical protein
MQVKWKWCDKLSMDNLKHKLYTTCNLWKEAPIPSLQYILCLSMGTTSKCHFSLGILSGNPQIGTFGVLKLGLYLSQNFGHSYISQIIFFLKMQGQYLIPL